MSVDAERLKQEREKLQEELQELAERVVGSGHPDAPGVLVDVRPAPEMRELEHAKPITTTYDTVARVRVSDPDREKAARFAHAVAEAFEAEAARRYTGSVRVVEAGGSGAFDALFALGCSEPE
ncbi:MAG: hypothetical protein WKF65_08650 [Gaiellaceae bacterium]